MNGLPEIEETFVHLKINELVTDADDIQSLTIPGEEAGNSFHLPEELKRLGSIRVKGKFTGFYNDFVSNATFQTDAGSVSTNTEVGYRAVIQVFRISIRIRIFWDLGIMVRC